MITVASKLSNGQQWSRTASAFLTIRRSAAGSSRRNNLINSSAITSLNHQEEAKVITNFSGEAQHLTPPARPSPAMAGDLTFDNTEEAFRSKTTLEVLRAYLVFTLCSSNYLVENNMKLMKLAEKVLGKRLFKSLMGATFYGHFVAGEDEQAIKPIIERMRSFGVNAILNYSAEEDEGAARRGARNDPLKGDEDHLDRNVDIFLRCIEAVSSTTASTGFAAIKMTALGKPQLLARLTDVAKDGQTNVLTLQEEEKTQNMLKRLDTIFTAARDLDVRVMVDAEQTYFQPAISRLTMELMRKYNKEKAIVFNTYQNYLKDTFGNLLRDLEEADRENFYFGAKLVRGAYLEQERARAKAMGYEDPTNPTYEATTAMYQKSLTKCLKRIKELKAKSEERRVIAMVASNNEDTIRYAVNQMKDFGISPDDEVICFGQNLGMCDQISFPLGQNGYSVYKYTPFGPVEEVMPYLSRRVHENRGVLAKIQKERRMLLDELKRRVKEKSKPRPLSNSYAAY